MSSRTTLHMFVAGCNFQCSDAAGDGRFLSAREGLLVQSSPVYHRHLSLCEAHRQGRNLVLLCSYNQSRSAHALPPRSRHAMTHQAGNSMALGQIGSILQLILLNMESTHAPVPQSLSSLVVTEQLVRAHGCVKFEEVVSPAPSTPPQSPVRRLWHVQTPERRRTPLAIWGRARRSTSSSSLAFDGKSRHTSPDTVTKAGTTLKTPPTAAAQRCVAPPVSPVSMHQVPARKIDWRFSKEPGLHHA